MYLNNNVQIKRRLNATALVIFYYNTSNTVSLALLQERCNRRLRFIVFFVLKALNIRQYSILYEWSKVVIFSWVVIEVVTGYLFGENNKWVLVA